MQPNININRQTPGQSQPDYHYRGADEVQNLAGPPDGIKMGRLVTLVVLVVLLAIIVVLLRDKWGGPLKQKAEYQAVFLTNGQVYFGKLSDVNSDYVTLTDIYYLQQLNEPLQAGGQIQGQQQKKSPDFFLVKLGNELHGPVDVMHISRAQLLFYEDLKANGKVLQAIYSFKQSGGNPPVQQQPQGSQDQQGVQQSPQPQGQQKGK